MKQEEYKLVLLTDIDILRCDQYIMKLQSKKGYFGDLEVKGSLSESEITSYLWPLMCS